MTQKEFLKRFKSHVKKMIPVMGKDSIIQNLEYPINDFACPFFFDGSHLAINSDNTIGNYLCPYEIKKEYTESVEAWANGSKAFSHSTTTTKKMIAIVKSIKGDK